ncbi:membrane-associatingdomain-containing protein [Cordyceps javanica]|uniref:Membrane-associatingdomain-containing protein n=1 Tax=Cordyceps javanica TaxID=43265 RepID=A0A545VC17_9HYPO|nr:membrane-associatingdomain-containing protein [Cordyceps javanica]TQW11061.1 membrane-associating domain-containing protein [Cordyceps javanica]
MSRGTSLGLKTVQWLIRCVQLLCAVIILGIYSYLLAALANHDLPTPTRVRAVEGIVGVAVAYALLGLLLLCCLAGRTLTSFTAMCLDFAFLCAYIFVAVANKGGAGSCTGEVNTVFGKGKAGDTLDAGGGFTKIPSYRTACKLETACLAIAIIAIFFYIFSIFVELALGRNHQREKRLANSPPQMQMPYAENPYNNYQPTPSYQPDLEQPSSPRPAAGGFLGRVFGGRRNRGQQALPQHDPNNLPEHAHPVDVNAAAADEHNRDSQVTAVGHEQQPPYNKYETGYGNASPTAHSPMVTGHTTTAAGDAAATAATYTYTHAGDPYTHAGDRYGHAGDDYHHHYRANAPATATTTLPYPANDDPYDTPYEPHRATPAPARYQQTGPRYPAPSHHHYDDGIYDRP